MVLILSCLKVLVRKLLNSVNSLLRGLCKTRGFGQGQSLSAFETGAY
jgi:hypothetical protein